MRPDDAHEVSWAPELILIHSRPPAARSFASAGGACGTTAHTATGAVSSAPPGLF